MQKLISVGYFIFLETIRDYMTIVLTLILPIMLLILVNCNITAIPAVTFKANFDLPVWVKTSENPDAVLLLKGNTLKVEIKTKDPTKVGMIKGVVWKIVSKLKGTKPFYNVEYVKVSTLNEKSYILAGMLSLSILSSGMVTITRTLSRYIDKKVTKFISTTPVKIHFYTSIFLNSTLITAISALILLVLAKVIDIEYSLSVLRFVAILLSGTISAAIGFVISLTVRSRTGSVAIASIIYTILPPFSGMYFPIELLPKYLQSISYYLPSTWIFLIVKHALRI